MQPKSSVTETERTMSTCKVSSETNRKTLKNESCDIPIDVQSTNVIPKSSIIKRQSEVRTVDLHKARSSVASVQCKSKVSIERRKKSKSRGSSSQLHVAKCKIKSALNLTKIQTKSALNLMKIQSSSSTCTRSKQSRVLGAKSEPKTRCRNILNAENDDIPENFVNDDLPAGYDCNESKIVNSLSTRIFGKTGTTTDRLSRCYAEIM